MVYLWVELTSGRSMVAPIVLAMAKSFYRWDLDEAHYVYSMGPKWVCLWVPYGTSCCQ